MKHKLLEKCTPSLCPWQTADDVCRGRERFFIHFNTYEQKLLSFQETKLVEAVLDRVSVPSPIAIDILMVHNGEGLVF